MAPHATWEATAEEGGHSERTDREGGCAECDVLHDERLCVSLNADTVPNRGDRPCPLDIGDRTNAVLAEISPPRPASSLEIAEDASPDC